MTCVWTSIIKTLEPEDVKKLGSTPHALVNTLKQLNTITLGVMWQGQLVIPKQLQENKEWVDNYDTTLIASGHLTGSADPFIFLISFLLNIRIIHCFNGNLIIYMPPLNKPRYTIRLRSSGSHMTNA